MATHYETLEISRTASPQEIRQAYRRLVKLYHPDTNPDKPEAVQRMVLINEAYNVIKDPVRRAQYDSLLALQTQTRSQEPSATEARESRQEIPHYRCEQCGKQDSSLRMSIFLSVVSYLVLTQKKAHAHILCSKCRIKHSLLSNLSVWILGWWGFPWGPIYSIEALFNNLKGGDQPADNNVALLSLLAYDFYTQNRYKECYEALRSAFALRPDNETKLYMDQIKVLAFPEGARSSSARVFSLGPAWFNVPFLGVLAVLSGLLLNSTLMQNGNNGHSQSPPSGPSEEIRKSVEPFFMGYEYLADVNRLVHELTNSKDIPADLDKMRTLLNQSKESLSLCDAERLNGIYPGWGDILSQKLMPAVGYYLAGLQQNADRSDLSRGDALIVDFDAWMQNNISKLLIKLHTDYGFEVK